MFKGFFNINTNQNYYKLNNDVWESNQLWTIATKKAGSLALNLQFKGYYAQSYTMFEYYKTMLAYIKIVYYKHWLLYFAPIDTIQHVLKAALKNEKPIIDSFPKDSDRAEQLIFTSSIPFVKICTICDGPSIEKLVGHLLQVIQEIRSLLKPEVLSQPIEPTLEIIGRFLPNTNAKENIMGELLKELSCYFPSSIIHLAINNDNEIHDMVDNMVDNQIQIYNGVPIYLAFYFEHFQKEALQGLPKLEMPPTSRALRADHHDMLVVMSRKYSEVDQELASMIFTMNDGDQIYFNSSHGRMIYEIIPELLGFLSRKLKILYKPLDSISQENLENKKFLSENPNVGTVYIHGNSSADYLIGNWNHQETEAISILSFMPFLKFCYYPTGPSVKDFITHFVKQKAQVLAEKREWSFQDFKKIFPSNFKADFEAELAFYHKILNSQNWHFQEGLMENWLKCTTSQLEE